MNNKITKRLSRDTTYTKTKKTYQEKLSPAEIKKKLEEYKQVEDISGLVLGNHLRYFTFNKKTGEKQFRLGGFLSKIDPKYQYVILQNGSFSWSVQIKGTIFFRKLSFADLKQELADKISKKYKNKIKKLEDDNKKLKFTLKQIKESIKKK